MRRRLFDVLSGEHTHDARRLQLGQRSHAAAHRHFGHFRLVGNFVGIGFGHRVAVQPCMSRSRYAKRGNTEDADSYLAVETGECAVALAGKLPPDDDIRPFLMFVVHVF